MDLSVVVVNWNSGDYLGRLIRSLAPLQDEVEATLVVDNQSSDLSPAALGPDLSSVRLLEPGRNLGFAGGANFAIGACRSRFVLLLNPDVSIRPGSVRRLYRHLQQYPDAAIGCGPLHQPDGSRQDRFQVRQLPTAGSVLADTLFLDELLCWLGRQPGYPLSGSVQSVPQAAAAYWLLRRSVWQKLGGFDEDFFPAWFEDVDFCKRAIERGWRILFFPDCPADHQGGISVPSLGRDAFLRIYYRNLYRYLRKHHPRQAFLLWAPIRLGTWIRRWMPSTPRQS